MHPARQISDKVECEIDKCYYGCGYIIIHEERGNIRYDQNGHFLSKKISKSVDIRNVKIFHVHYAVFDRCKPNDNRFGDLGLFDYWRAGRLPDKITDEMFDYLTTINHGYALKTEPYKSDYPKCLHEFLQ